MTLPLPPELLTEILSYAKSDGIEITYPKTYPTNLSLVCKSWHALTLSASEIWSDIRISLDRRVFIRLTSRGLPIKYLGAQTLSALQTCLERSGSLKPLTFYIRARDSCAAGFGAKKVLLRSILSILLRHAHRWSEISFDFPIDTFVSMFPPDRSYPCLRRVDLLYGVQDFPVSNYPPTGTFSNAPVLRELHLHRFPGSLSQLSIPWSQITHFSLSVSATIPVTTMRLVELMTSLHSLTLHQVHPLSLDSLFSSLPVPSGSPLDLPVLEKLRICTAYAYFEICHFLKRIYAPRLTTLELELHPYKHPANWIPEFEDLVTRSQCKITCLELRNVPGEVVLVMLKYLSSTVEILELEDVQFSEELLRRMAIPRSICSLSPSLDAERYPCLGQHIKRVIIDKPSFVDAENGPTMFVSMIRSLLPTLRFNYPPTFRHDPVPPPTPSITPENRESPTMSLRIVTPRLDQTPNKSGNPTRQTTSSLYQLLVKNFAKSDYEAMGVKLEILKEDDLEGSEVPLPPVGRAMRGHRLAWRIGES